MWLVRVPGASFSGSPGSLIPRLSWGPRPQALLGTSSPDSPGSLVPRLSLEPRPHALQSQLICLPLLSDSIRGAGRRLPILEYTLHITSSSPTELRAAGFVHWHVPHWGFRKEEYAPSQTSSASRTSKSSPASSKAKGEVQETRMSSDSFAALLGMVRWKICSRTALMYHNYFFDPLSLSPSLSPQDHSVADQQGGEPRNVMRCGCGIVPGSAPTSLNKLFNLSISHGRFPESWKTSTVVPIPKSANQVIFTFLPMYLSPKLVGIIPHYLYSINPLHTPMPSIILCTQLCIYMEPLTA